MSAMAQLAAAETARSARLWATGGSDLYPPEKEIISAAQASELRPRQSVEQEYVKASDEALEHIGWCMAQGMTPQDVADSLSRGKELTADTWLMAAFLVEQEAWAMRLKK
ncbi:MAG: hypothetical protein AAFQ38_15035 [Pseudomonadota bacterium]